MHAFRYYWICLPPRHGKVQAMLLGVSFIRVPTLMCRRMHMPMSATRLPRQANSHRLCQRHQDVARIVDASLAGHHSS